jgi:hypothetical protein
MKQLKEKPLLSIAQIFYMSFGFMGRLPIINNLIKRCRI